mmetsp:Transcript_7206/g.12932  ORF Transcript_7206/g.12932 Transcript_7206/m.12932 type:complete len:132 (-) Transcript_7206:68-463(-)|eukprot:CAMPEP_0198286736 /NCGR_PEP_ID=MMETSP1449-20131203/5719_1 /TAXON_ID=420275 /ORGANISM="Attheya septentrionalis, Strain CCMP2084" /LENGTH=131 /DNA_ID=CAMNT_0043984521 /DNA_START=165 /DNA_END=560 /DNA_ORIENTATION=+
MPVIVPICPPSSGNNGEEEEYDDTPREWSLLEFNGELVPPIKSPEDELSGPMARRMELGAIRFTSEGTPIMTVGTHELKGNIEPLKEPFVIMRKRKRLDVGNNNSSSTEYEVAGVIRKKMQFIQYPKIIMR